MKKILTILIVLCVLFFALKGRCEASFSYNEILKTASASEQSQLAISDIVKKATEDKTTISQTPLLLENLSLPKTLTVKNSFLGGWQKNPVNYALKVQCLRATDFTIVFCPCHHYISELRL
ncbi:MAG: hypothetical protein KKA81_16050 [Bacteroidetes bacterium]|nr:hypothetical protein [Bacteroidota bacterium]